MPRHVVLLHGFSEDGACWAPFTRRLLAPGEIAHAPDARGHGHAPRDLPATTAGWREDAVALVETLDGEVDLIGHSMGARTALQAAAELPGRIALVVLLDPPLHPGPPSEELAPVDLESRGWLEVRRLQALPPDARLVAVERIHPEWTREECGLWSDALGRLAPDVFGPELFRYDHGWRDDARRLDAPTLVVHGELERGGIVAPSVVAELAELLPPRSTVMRVPGTGHLPHRERPEETLAVVRAFLDGRPVPAPAP